MTSICLCILGIWVIELLLFLGHLRFTDLQRHEAVTNVLHFRFFDPMNQNPRIIFLQSSNLSLRRKNLPWLAFLLGSNMLWGQEYIKMTLTALHLQIIPYLQMETCKRPPILATGSPGTPFRELFPVAFRRLMKLQRVDLYQVTGILLCSFPMPLGILEVNFVVDFWLPSGSRKSMPLSNQAKIF